MPSVSPLQEDRKKNRGKMTGRYVPNRKRKQGSHREHMDRAMCFNDCRTRCISRKCYAKLGIRVIATKSEVRPFMDRKGRDIWNRGNRPIDPLAVDLKRVKHNRVSFSGYTETAQRAPLSAPRFPISHRGSSTRFILSKFLRVRLHAKSRPSHSNLSYFSLLRRGFFFSRFK